MEPQTLEVYAELTEKEINERSRELANVLTEVMEIKDELSSHQKTEKAKIEAKEVRAKELIHSVKSGKEKKTFECEVEKNYDNKEWVYKDVATGKIVKTEQFALDDFQRDLDEGKEIKMEVDGKSKGKGKKDQVLPEEPVTEKTAIRYAAVEIKNGKETGLQFFEDFANPGETIREAAERIVELFNKTRKTGVLAKRVKEVKLLEK